MLEGTTLGSMNYHVLRTIIKEGEFLKLCAGAEIGVLYGDTSAYLLKEFPQLTLLSVDPYVEYHEDADDRSQSTMNWFEEHARSRLAEFGERSQLIKDFSLNAALLIPDECLDFVFLDALHTYDAVKEDIAAWYPKVRSGGLFCGHDYHSWPEVGQAVDEFCEGLEVKGFYTPITSDVWFFKKL